MNETFSLDFTELKTDTERAGYGFQALVAEIGEKLGYRVLKGGVGADRGRDLLFDVTVETIAGKHESFRWLVSCKDYSHSGKSVGIADVTGLRDRAMEHNCHGILLGVTTSCSDQIIEQFKTFEVMNVPIKTMIWDKHRMTEMLAAGKDDLFRLTLARYFPVSSGVSKSTRHLIEQTIKVIRESELDLDGKVKLLCRLASTQDGSLNRWAVLRAVLEQLNPPLECCYPVFDFYMTHYQHLEFAHDEFLSFVHLNEAVEERADEVMTKEIFPAGCDAKNNVHLMHDSSTLYRHDDGVIVLEKWGLLDVLKDGEQVDENLAYFAAAHFAEDGFKFVCWQTTLEEVAMMENAKYAGKT